ncbi:hypothetical protein Tco_1152265 [Tanacetum coccineum]
MTKDSSIPRRNWVNWHFARNDPMFTTIRVVSRHEDTQLYGAILPDELKNEAIKDSESYKEYYAIASGAKPPKTKASVKKKKNRSDKTKTPPTAKDKRLKTSAKVAKPAKKKQTAKTSKAKGLAVLSEELSSDEEDDDEVAMSGDDDDDADNQDDDDNDDDDQNDDNTDNENDDNDDDDDGQDHEGQDDDNEQTDSDNDGDDFVHPKFSTHDEEDNKEEGSDLRVQTPSHYESTDDEESDEITHGANVEGEELDKEETNEEDEANELYRDVNVNLEGRDTEMTNAARTIIQTTQVIEDTHVIITLVNPEGQQQSSSVSSGFISNMLNPSQIQPPLLSATILPPPPIPLITHLHQTPVPTPTTVPTVSLIPGIVDMYLASKMNEAVKIVVQLQSNRLRYEAQAKNEDFINKLDDSIKKIIKEQVKEQVKAQVSKILPKTKKAINEQLKAEVLTRSSNESKTYFAIAVRQEFDT